MTHVSYIKCDWCGQPIVRGDNDKFSWVIKEKNYTYNARFEPKESWKQLDLCPDCVAKVKEFINDQF